MDPNAPIVWYLKGLGGVAQSLQSITREGAILQPGALALLREAQEILTRVLVEQELRSQ